MAGPRLAGKVALVTGGRSRAEGIGNGRVTALLSAREGARVLVVDQNRDAAEATLAMVKGEGGEAAAFAADDCGRPGHPFAKALVFRRRATSF